jgi:isoleucyl-tRNA synthetase
MSYQETINLPKTDFSMKADLVKKEPLIRQKWENDGLYQQILKKHQGQPKYILHDGPPYANGDVHIGTALNKILKDIVVKFKAMQGHYAPYIPGWDCHGLPIEHRVMTQMGDKAKTIPKPQLRLECEKYARRYIDIQRKQFQALGVLGDWHNPYLTLDPSYEAAVIEVFGDLVKNGYIYRKLKPVHWCMHCETVLAEAELEYSDETGPSIYVKFPLTPDQAKELASKITNLKLAISNLFTLSEANVKLSFFIWTTTPWTLPANVAVALNPQFEYALVSASGGPASGGQEILIMADGLVEKVMAAIGIKDYKVLGKVKGNQLEGLAYPHPFVKRDCRVILADYVSLEDGTGIVHIATGHGQEDYESGLKYNLPVISPVDKSGRFTAEAGIFPGERVFDADPKIIRMLEEQKLLLKRVDVVHSYPHCWRCKKPLIFRATEQWFISVDNQSARRRAIEEIRKARWVPQWGKTRTAAMLESRPDWCVSRQRNWGVPIPVFYCAKCREPLLDGAVIDFVRDIFRKEGANSWFTKPVPELLPKGARCKCGSTEFNKENDIFDVWFESGSSFRAVVIEDKDLQFPADLYLEGSDQPARWFQLSLLPSVMTRGQAPFKNVLIHGFVKRPEGEKLSKSKGALSSDDIVAKLGADILRLWIASINFTDDIPVSMEILAESTDPYRKIRNTFRYMLGNLADFDPARDGVAHNDLPEIDRWALNRLHRLIQGVTGYYESFEFYRAFKSFYEFCVVDMSAFYFDILKDRIYTSGKASKPRRAAQTAIYRILDVLTRLIAPILAHTAEEIWGYVPGEKDADSVHLAGWPKADPALISDELESAWTRLIGVRSDVARELEKLRQDKTIGSSLEATVKLYTEDKDLLALLKKYELDLPMILIVSEARLADAKPDGAVAGLDNPALWVKADKAPYPKCQRCWNYRPSVGKDAQHPDICQRCADVLKNTDEHR